MNDKHTLWGVIGGFITWLGGFIDLNTFCMVMGLLFGFVSLMISWYYKRKNAKVFAEAAAKAAERGYVLHEPKE